MEYIEKSPFFEEQRAKGAIVVKDAPKFDLESYASNYDGEARLRRLHHVGSTSTFLAMDAYRLAITEAKQGKNVPLYLLLVEQFSRILPGHRLGIPDLGWADRRAREVKDEVDKLEHSLKSYKNNLIKESIRLGNEELGDFYLQCGIYGEAQKAYTRMREYCTSPGHLADMQLRLMYVGIAQKSWTSVQAHIVKVDQLSLKGEERSNIEPILSACAGLANLCCGNYLDAANSFLHTSPQFINAEPAAKIVWQRQVLSPNDVAVYGALCALASMDRTELQEHVLANSNFRNFLELEPHIRRAISLFCNSKYSACLEVLEAYRTDYLLDVYLSKAVATIYRHIRTKSIVQYFIPFSCVTLDEMASRFQATAAFASIEDELEEMINMGVLDARIDLVDRLLISPPINPRYSVHSDALTMAERYDHTLRLRLTRLNLQNADLSMKGDKNAIKESGTPLGEGLFKNLGSRFGIS